MSMLRPVRTAPVAINQPLFSGATSRAPILSCSPERIWLGEGGKSLLAHCGAPGPGQTLATLTSSWTVNTSMCVSLLEGPGKCAPGNTLNSCRTRKHQTRMLLQGPAWSPSGFRKDRGLSLEICWKKSHFR